MKLGDSQQDFVSPGEALEAHISEESSENSIDHRSKPGTPAEVLAHYGKKGMRWGVRNEDEPVGRDSSGKIEPSPQVKQRIARVTRTDQPQILRPSSDGKTSRNEGRVGEVAPKEEHGLTRNQKIAIGVGVAGVGLAGYVAYKHYTGNTMPGLDLDKIKQEEQMLVDMKLPAKWDTRGLKDGPLSTRKLGDLAGDEINAKLRGADTDSLMINTSHGYADIVHKKGFLGVYSAAAEERHASVTKVLEEMRDKYPSIRNMNIEVVPMSLVPGLEKSSAEMCVMSMRAGEARVIYNDLSALPTKEAIRANRRFLPGLGAKDYVAYHEMGHLLAAAHGDLPPSFHLLGEGASPKAWRQWQKAEPLLHKRTFARHAFSFKELSRLSQYAATEPAEAMAELAGHYHHPEMRSRLTPEQIVRAQAMFDEMGGLRG